MKDLAKGFNQAVLDGELDRTIELEPESKSIYRAVKAHAIDKKITFTSFSHEYSPSQGRDKYGGEEVLPRKIQVEFQKVCTGEDDHIEILVKKWTKMESVKRCDMGHDHGTRITDFDLWERMNLSWEDFEELLNWFQTGRFYDPRTRQAKARKDKKGFHSKEKL